MTPTPPTPTAADKELALRIDLRCLHTPPAFDIDLCAQLITATTSPLREQLAEAKREVERLMHEPRIGNIKSFRGLHELITHWAKDAQKAAEGGYGPTPKGELLEYWRGNSSALHEVLCAIPFNQFIGKFKDEDHITTLERVIGECQKFILWMRQREKDGYLSFCGFGHNYNKKIDKALASINELGLGKGKG